MLGSVLLGCKSYAAVKHVTSSESGFQMDSSGKEIKVDYLIDNMDLIKMLKPNTPQCRSLVRYSCVLLPPAQYLNTTTIHQC